MSFKSIAAIVGAWVLLAGAAHAQLALAPGDAAPGLRGRTIEGQRKVVDYAANRFTLINFWATWCAPCADEMPALQQLHDMHGASDVEIIGVLMEDIADEPVKEFLDRLSIGYTVVRPDAWVNGVWGGIGVMPTTFLVNHEGRIMRRYVGATAEQIAGLLDDVAAVLDGRPMKRLVTPERPAAVTEQDRQRLLEAAKSAEDGDDTPPD